MRSAIHAVDNLFDCGHIARAGFEDELIGNAIDALDRLAVDLIGSMQCEHDSVAHSLVGFAAGRGRYSRGH